MAEKVRFELTEVLPSAVFKTAALNHSATSPLKPYSIHDFVFQIVSVIRSRLYESSLLFRIKLFFASYR